MNALAHNFEPYLTSHEQVELYNIAHQMKSEDLPDEFIATAVRMAFKFEGISDLLKLWFEETNNEEKDEIIADINELIDDCSATNVKKTAYIQLNDLETIAKDIRIFKDNLLAIVIKHGGISKLAELTHIPQPSLSRFFNSNAMPRRATLLKIAAALKLDAIKITTPWAH